MEVHHHPDVEKKSFKEYLLEGLMIFIAVTMGFFAETIREGINENHRADTLMQLLATADPAKIPSGKLYWYGPFGGAYKSFVPNDATFEQMKSSGTLSYLDKTIAKDVAGYDRLCRQMQEYDNSTAEIYAQVRISRSKLFEFNYNDIANSIYQFGAGQLKIARDLLFQAKNLEKELKETYGE